MQKQENEKLPLAERWNSLTHGAGILLSVVGSIVLFFLSYNSPHPDTLKVMSFAIYGVSLILLYTASTLYHSTTRPALKKTFQIIDHVSIYLLIAGTYTPFTLVTLRGNWGWTVFAVIWTLAFMGIVFQLFFYTDKLRKISAIIYILMGWVIVIAIKPLTDNLPTGGLLWMLAGGIFYSGGVFFYIRKKNPFNHVIWHFFVLGGSITHFFAIFFYLLPA